MVEEDLATIFFTSGEHFDGFIGLVGVRMCQMGPEKKVEMMMLNQTGRKKFP